MRGEPYASNLLILTLAAAFTGCLYGREDVRDDRRVESPPPAPYDTSAPSYDSGYQSYQADAQPPPPPAGSDISSEAVFYERLVAVRVLDLGRAVWPRLGPCRRLRLASLLLRRVGPDRLGLDVRLRRSVGLGGVSLRPLELRNGCRLVLDPGVHLGPRVGELEIRRGLRQLVPARPFRRGVRISTPGLGRRPGAALHESHLLRRGACAANVWSGRAGSSAGRTARDRRPYRQLRPPGRRRGTRDRAADPARWPWRRWCGRGPPRRRGPA